MTVSFISYYIIGTHTASFHTQEQMYEAEIRKSSCCSRLTLALDLDEALYLQELSSANV